MRNYEFFMLLSVVLIAVFVLSRPIGLPPGFSMRKYDPKRTEWTPEGKKKIRAEWAEEERLHDEFEKTYRPDQPKIDRPTWIVVETTCGVTINNQINGGRWPYSTALTFATKDAAKKHIERWCMPHGCVLVRGIVVTD